MKRALASQLAILTVLGISSFGSSLPAQAIQFDQTEIAEPSRLVVMASPIGTTSSYKLLIFEQLKDSRECWREMGENPTLIEPLFLEFDFTGICGRGTDSNAYSVRTAGQDLVGRYHLRLARRQNELVLLAFSLTDRNAESFEIGRTHGLAEGFIKVHLDPGWRLTRRTFEGKTLGHIYFTSDRSVTELASRSTPAYVPAQTPPAQVPPAQTSPAQTPPAETFQPVPNLYPAPNQAPTGYSQPLQPLLPPVPVPVPQPLETQPTQPFPAPNSTSSEQAQPSPFPTPGPRDFVVPTAPAGSPGTTPLPYYQNSTPQSSRIVFPPVSSARPTTQQATNHSVAAGYRVVVYATTPQQQQQVRQIAPGAFRTTLNGKPVLQAGIFRDRATAESLEQQFAAQKLTVQILPTALPNPKSSTSSQRLPATPSRSASNAASNLGSNSFNLPQPNSAALTQSRSLWATYYYTHRAENTFNGYPLLDPTGNRLGISLSHKDWCAAALQGSVQITNGQQILGTYNFAGRGAEPQVDCTPFYPTLKAVAETNRVRFKPSPSLYGEGSGGNLLVPYRTIAVDTTRIPIGSVIYIPEARGTVVTLPSGQQAVHDGYFYAADVGAAIKNDQIDVFIGVAERNPFRFIRSTANVPFTAYIVTDPQIQSLLASQHQMNQIAAR